MTFNSDGSGKWEYALENDIEWKLKGDKLTIVEKWEDDEFGGQEETYKATWDGKEIVLDIWGLKYLFEKTDDSASADDSEKASVPTDEVTTNLVGSYDCIDSEMQGTKLDPAGEWLELKEDGTGEWFLGVTEDKFLWTSDGKKIDFDVEIEGQEATLSYVAKLDGDEIVLDTGVLYYFSKKSSEKVAETAVEVVKNSSESNERTWVNQPAGSIKIPSQWYGVANFINCEGFDFEKDNFDIWGEMDFEDGRPYLELFRDIDRDTYPILSIYLDEEVTDWLTPIIGEDDAWVYVDPYGDYQHNLNKDFEWTLLSQYIEGSIDIYHTYVDDNGGYADCRFFIREMGTGWNEDNDPLPPGYEGYKEQYSK